MKNLFDTGRMIPVEGTLREMQRFILLVEDDRLSRRMTSLQLEKMGYRVHAVTNGKEALEALSEADYALVLMDCNMPVMDGYEASLAIRKRESGTSKHLPIIALTAYAMEGDRRRCLSAGMDDYLAKPIRIEKLKEKLDYWYSPGETWGSNSTDERLDTEPSFYEEIDSKVFEGLKQLQIEGNPNVIKELVGIYLRDTSHRLELLREAEKRRDLKDVQRLAHSLKSISSMIGAFKVGRLCKELEEGCRNGMMEKDSVTRIEKAYISASKVLKTFLEPTPYPEGRVGEG